MSSIISTFLITVLFFLMSFLSKYKPFRNWAAKQLESSLTEQLSPYVNYRIRSPGFQLIPAKNGGSVKLQNLAYTLNELKEYQSRGKMTNSIISKRTNELIDTNWLEQLNKVRYFDKISQVNESVSRNYKVIENIIEYVLKEMVNTSSKTDKKMINVLRGFCTEFGFNLDTNGSKLQRKIGYKDETIVLQSNSNQNRVIEAINHLCRDWSDSFKLEREPIVDYVQKRLESCQLGDNSLVVLPGSGLGRLAHSIAEIFPSVDVDSVELSTLMYVCNQFALHFKRDVEICPFNMFYSGQLDVKKQTRPFNVSLSKVSFTPNLNTLLEDFRKYTPRKLTYDKIIIVTEYFIDTAENMFEYFENIESLKQYSNNLQWINVGPLKYGTRPLVQFTVEELNSLRRIRKWEDIDVQVNTKQADLNGYLTDYESLYQGYYGLLKFHSRYQGPHT
ncbi:uncharacterized protein NDAI_0K01430 [Naumovozyma dairenensis CBS 421]|uniref:Uncharacterized protein n=1 Tax=Naumovozyma dairenensis (strain ATCC 10597 / BCRC 20456 / CBS 421 / NBRC 0211 / NRRL Y-12639) TaxID=1071378 RepID=G0WHS3_NAUDC|nr:hypothetical protein NDAI_0K01430 [Naumovozyma dairenensis CBS 421]CCD27334.1 hypothetical protein NDAI_0K01430 [Naumovozyma dairenensis CBS 421]